MNIDLAVDRFFLPRKNVEIWGLKNQLRVRLFWQGDQEPFGYALDVDFQVDTGEGSILCQVFHLHAVVCQWFNH